MEVNDIGIINCYRAKTRWIFQVEGIEKTEGWLEFPQKHFLYEGSVILFTLLNKNNYDFQLF